MQVLIAWDVGIKLTARGHVQPITGRKTRVAPVGGETVTRDIRRPRIRRRRTRLGYGRQSNTGQQMRNEKEDAS